MGAIGPGNEGWIDFDASPLDAGEYALIASSPAPTASRTSPRE